MLDTHSHLADPVAFPPADLPGVLARAAAAGVVGVVVVTEAAADIPRMLALTSPPPLPLPLPQPPPRVPVRLFPAIGVHPAVVSALPTDAAAVEEVAVAMAAAADAGAALVAVGEIGLDYTPRVLASGSGVGGGGSSDAAPVQPTAESAADAIRSRQVAALHTQLDAAAALGVPATVHSRGAGRHVVALLVARASDGRPTPRVVLHAFDGRPVHAAAAVAAGAYLSIPPSVVRAPPAGGGGSATMRKWLPRVPLGRLLLESDAPALGPVPGERGEPAHVRRAAEMVAALRGVAVADVLAAVDATAREVFPRTYGRMPG